MQTCTGRICNIYIYIYIFFWFIVAIYIHLFGGADVNLQLPFIAVARIHQLFSGRFKFEKLSPSSPLWKILLFVGLPKTTSITDFNDFRWICKSPILHQWYLRAMQHDLRSQLKPSCVHSYGFRRHTSTSDVTGLFRVLLHYASVWKMPLIAALQDVKTAFDSMPHALISQALISKGAFPRTQWACTLGS